jgi:hypothetical protein
MVCTRKVWGVLGLLLALVVVVGYGQYGQQPQPPQPPAAATAGRITAYSGSYAAVANAVHAAANSTDGTPLPRNLRCRSHLQESSMPLVQVITLYLRLPLQEI